MSAVVHGLHFDRDKPHAKYSFPKGNTKAVWIGEDLVSAQDKGGDIEFTFKGPPPKKWAYVALSDDGSPPGLAQLTHVSLETQGKTIANVFSEDPPPPPPPPPSWQRVI